LTGKYITLAHDNPLFYSLPVLLLLFTIRKTQGFLKAEGQAIVNEKGEKVILRGMGLGGWMLQEPYIAEIEWD
jgi:endoglucanase